MNEALQNIYRRRSVRKYTEGQIKEEELMTILEAGRMAPVGMNAQSWRFTVIQNKDLIERINKALKEEIVKAGIPGLSEAAKNPEMSVFYHASTLIVVSDDPTKLTYQYDGTLALGTMFLAASSIGIGSCWTHAISHMNDFENCKDLVKELGIPEGHEIVCGASFGYPDGDFPKGPDRKDGVFNIIK
jgi:nitroreductase